MLPMRHRPLVQGIQFRKLKGTLVGSSFSASGPRGIFLNQSNAGFGETKRPGYENAVHHILAVLPQSTYLTSMRSIFPSVKWGQLYLEFQCYLERMNEIRYIKPPTKCLTLGGLQQELIAFLFSFQFLFSRTHPPHCIKDKTVAASGENSNVTKGESSLEASETHWQDSSVSHTLGLGRQPCSWPQSHFQFCRYH